ncbi:MAG: hypothetical protein JWN78_2921 [Bacteroidota bacterium]|nr:hypothetical protein [Bacteroidota bacterium]
MNKFVYIFFIAGIVLLSFSVTSCYYDKEETLYGGGICDTSNISYSNKVVPILTVYCSSCHSAVNAPVLGSGLILEGYNNISIYLQQHQQTLINAVKQNGSAKSMPPTSKIDKCSIAFLEAWILQGKKNN